MRLVAAFVVGLGLSVASCVLVSLLVVGWDSTLGFLRFFFGLGRWRYRCPACMGTGLCHTASGQPLDHSCCGDCRRIEVPVSKLPSPFNPRPEDFPAFLTFPLGCGYLTGSLWDVLRRGRWRPAMHHCPDVATEFSRRKS